MVTIDSAWHFHSSCKVSADLESWQGRYGDLKIEKLHFCLSRRKTMIAHKSYNPCGTMIFERSWSGDPVLRACTHAYCTVQRLFWTQICSSSSSSKCLPNAWCWCCSQLRQGRMQLHVMLLCVHACSLFASRHCSVQTQLDWRRLRRLCFDPHGKSMKFGNYRRALKSAGEHGAKTS